MTRYRVFKGKKAERVSTAYEQCYKKNKYTLKEARATANVVCRSGRFKMARIYECSIGGKAHWHIAKQN